MIIIANSEYWTLGAIAVIFIAGTASDFAKARRTKDELEMKKMDTNYLIPEPPPTKPERQKVTVEATLCEFCKKPYLPKVEHQKYCSEKCRTKFYKTK
jgi:hypothetical protein